MTERQTGQAVRFIDQPTVILVSKRIITPSEPAVEEVEEQIPDTTPQLAPSEARMPIIPHIRMGGKLIPVKEYQAPSQPSLRNA